LKHQPALGSRRRQTRRIAENTGLGYSFSKNRGDKTLVIIIHRQLRKYSLALGSSKRETIRIAESMGYG
jgi:hypothetical protein